MAEEKVKKEYDDQHLGGKFVPYNEMTDAQKKEFHRMGSEAARKKNQLKRQLKDYLECLLSSETHSGDVEGDLCWALIRKGLNGDVKAFEVIRNTMGEDSPTKLQVENKEIKVTLEDD